jgi:hypothetical protein
MHLNAPQPCHRIQQASFLRDRPAENHPAITTRLLPAAQGGTGGTGFLDNIFSNICKHGWADRHLLSQPWAKAAKATAWPSTATTSWPAKVACMPHATCFARCDLTSYNRQRTAHKQWQALAEPPTQSQTLHIMTTGIGSNLCMAQLRNWTVCWHPCTAPSNTRKQLHNTTLAKNLSDMYISVL